MEGIGAHLQVGEGHVDVVGKDGCGLWWIERGERREGFGRRHGEGIRRRGGRRNMRCGVGEKRLA